MNKFRSHLALLLLLAFCGMIRIEAQAQITGYLSHYAGVQTGSDSNGDSGYSNGANSSSPQASFSFTHSQTYGNNAGVSAAASLTANDAIANTTIDLSGTLATATTNAFGGGAARNIAEDDDTFDTTVPVYYTCTCTSTAAGDSGCTAGGYVTLCRVYYDSNGRHLTEIFLMGNGFVLGLLPSDEETPTPPGTISGTLPAGEYEFNATANCSEGYFGELGTNGAVNTAYLFHAGTTAPTPPTAATLPVSNVTKTSAFLNGTVNPNGNAVTAYFEYGLAGSSTYTNTVSVPVTSGTGTGQLSVPVGSLVTKTRYHCQLVVQNGQNTILGGDVPFVLPDPSDPDNVGPDDPTAKQCGASTGMATYDFHAELASLKIADTPVGYAPPYGNPMPFTVTYTQREASQPAVLNFSNLGPQWNINWLTYITDDPSDPTAVSGQARPSGGRLPAAYLGADSTYYQYQLMGKPGMKLRRALANPLPYEIVNADGSKDVYGQSDGSTVAPRKIFLTQRVDSAGNVTTLTYDANLRITKITDALGQAMTLTYGLTSDPFKITKVTDPFGRFATFDYDNAGRLMRITDEIGLQSSFTYQGTSNFINSMTTPYGTTTFTDTEIGTVYRITATDPAGDTEVMESNIGQTAAISSSDASTLIPQGMTVTNAQLDTRNSFYWDKKQWKEGPNNYTKAHIYHWLKNMDLTTMSGYLESEKSPLESRIWYNYSDQTDPTVVGTNTTPSKIGRVIEGGTQLVSQNVTSLGKVSTSTDPVGRVTNYSYSADGIDLLGVSLTTATGQDQLATYTYNSQHRPLTYIDASLQPTTYTWNTVGQLLTVLNAKSETTTYSYYNANATGKQRNGRLYQIDGALSGNTDVVTFDYDATGNVAQVTGPDGYYLTYAYDALDRLTRVTYPDTTYTETTYLALDPQTTRDRLGRLTHYVYNSIRQLSSITDPANRSIQYNWCKCGSLSQIIDAMGRTTTWTRDLEGRATAKQYTDGSQITYSFEPLSGRLSFVTDELSQVKTRSYNLDDTLAGLTYTNAVHSTPNVTFTYDPAYRRLTQMVDGTGTTKYSYVPAGVNFGPYGYGAGQLSSVDGPLSTDPIYYTYDQLGRQTAYTINSVGETRTFDALGRVFSVVNPLGTFGYTYVGATSRMDTVTYPNGMTCAYSYYPLTGDFRMKDMIYNLSGSTQLAHHSYEYNVMGDITRWTQISSQASLNRSWLCGYDPADQLTSVTSQDPTTFANLSSGQYSYSYDLAGNRLTATLDGVTSTAGFNALNQFTSLSTSGTSTLVPQTYEWDAENRLTAINYPNTSQRSEFVYDGIGRRVRVTEKTGTNVVSDLRYIWDRLQLDEERDSTGATVQKRYFESGMQTLASGTLTPRMFARDHLGSVRDLVSSTAAVTSTYDFDPWGVRSMPTGQTDESEIAFTGHWFHAGSGFAFAPFRAYNSSSAKWLNRDPIAEVSDVNLYSYVANNPINRIDPLGLWQVTFGAALFVGGDVTFGYNNGRINIGGDVGFGVGLKLDYDPNEAKSGCASNGLAGRFGVKGAAGVAAGPIKLDIEGGYSTSIDQTGNAQTGFDVKLTPGIPYVPVSYSGSGQIGIEGNLLNGSGGKVYGRLDHDSKPSVGLGLGPWVLFGPSGGVSW